ncbi:hypothetical protein [Meiothermus sp. CFH 77666]|uniref:hypothetical protein n=1 Tax=Meiothermus sp. CFH 77666 TaxID=2817942 RepID=UPI001AA09C75|nr:hypothetical protein [Meiothermus sp. CFH 77666]MBO1438321.1 hypothetical protein [Meiothermus sp. CFH 77666]
MTREQLKQAWYMIGQIRIGLRLYVGLKPHTSTRHRIRSGYRLALSNARRLVALLEQLEPHETLD